MKTAYYIVMSILILAALSVVFFIGHKVYQSDKEAVEQAQVEAPQVNVRQQTSSTSTDEPREAPTSPTDAQPSKPVTPPTNTQTNSNTSDDTILKMCLPLVGCL